MMSTERLAVRKWRDDQRGWRAPIAHRSHLFEAIVAAAYLSLLYKLVAIGLLTLILLASLYPAIRSHNWKISWPAAGTSLAYIAMCTVTAFFVDKTEGIERTVQGIITIGAAVSLTKYLLQLSEEDRERFFKAFTVLNLIILGHVLIYHLAHGHLVTWKYLRDTKFVFAVIVTLLFFWEDKIKTRSIALWAILLLACVLIVVMSGERKAYLTFVACYLFSRARWTTVVTIAAGGFAAAALFAAAAPNSYVTRQLESAFVNAQTEEIPTRYFFTVSALADHSDLVRTFVNRNAAELFRHHPIWGLGSTGYIHWAQRTYGPIEFSRGLSMNVHGERNRVPVEGGLVGIVIALSFLTICATRIGLYWRAHGGTEASSRTRGPAFLYALMFFYTYFEALDTTMLILIILVGLTAASLHFSADHGALRREAIYPGRLRKRKQSSVHEPRLARAMNSGLLRSRT